MSNCSLHNTNYYGHNHTHNHCYHLVVRFCSYCNCTYCTNCGLEWRAALAPYHPPVPGWGWGEPYWVNNSGRTVPVTTTGTVPVVINKTSY